MSQEVIEAIKNQRCECGSPNIMKICFKQSCYPLFCDKCEQNHQSHKIKTIRELFDLLSHKNVIEEIINGMINRISQFAKTFNDQMERIIKQLNSKKQIINVTKLRDQIDIQNLFQEIKEKIEIIGGKLCFRHKILENFEVLQNNFLERIQKLYDNIQSLQISSIEESDEQFIPNPQVQSEITLFFQGEIVQSQNIRQPQQQSIQYSEIIRIDQNQLINSSFTQEYCSKNIKCESQKIIRKINYYSDNDAACLNIPLNKLDYKSFTFRINNSAGLIWIGIAKLEQLQNYQFIQASEKFLEGQNHGFYMVASNGQCYNSFYQEFNNKKKSICLEQKTDFRFIYDRKEKDKDFQINIYEKSFYMPLPPFINEQMSMVPCIIMENKDQEVELLLEQ